MSKILAFICVIGFTSFSVLGNDIETKADLEKMVVRYEKLAQLGKLCTSSKMKDEQSCNRFQKLYNSWFEGELDAMPDKLNAHIEIDFDTTMRGAAATILIGESVIDIVAHNEAIKANVRK